MLCPECSYKFVAEKLEHTVSMKPSGASIFGEALKGVEMDVTRIEMGAHTSKNKNLCLKVRFYDSDLALFPKATLYLQPEGMSFLQRRFWTLWKQIGNGSTPGSVQQAVLQGARADVKKASFTREGNGFLSLVSVEYQEDVQEEDLKELSL